MKPENWQHDEDENEHVATFGAGCYWGTEKFFIKDFNQLYPGSILRTSVGFMSPNPNAIPNPNYLDVCLGKTSHVEVAHFLFDSSIVDYSQLVKFFFTFHDPTTYNQ